MAANSAKASTWKCSKSGPSVVFNVVVVVVVVVVHVVVVLK